MNRLAAGLLALLSAFVVAATPLQNGLLEADRAFAEGRPDEALRLWADLESATDDPGMLAERQAVALSQLERWKEAEGYYRRAMGDAAIPADRRRRCLFSLGATLIRSAPGDPRRLREAIRIYDDLIDELPAGEMRRDSLWNLELAKLLRAKSLAGKAPPPEEENGDTPPPKNEPDRKQPDEPKGKDEPKTKAPGDKKDKGIAPAEAKGEAKGTTQKSPLKKPGEVPVLRDTEDVPVLSPEETRELLRRAALRLETQRRGERELRAGGREARPNDW